MLVHAKPCPKSTCYRFKFHLRILLGRGRCIVRSPVVMITWQAKFDLCAKLSFGALRCAWENSCAVENDDIADSIHAHLNLLCIDFSWDRYMFTVCSLCVHYMFILYSLHIHYMFTNFVLQDRCTPNLLSSKFILFIQMITTLSSF